MKFSRIPSALLLAGALGASTLLSAPSLHGYSLLGGSLGILTAGNGYQRDVRIFNNSTDAASNDNQVPSLSHPGALGAPQAVWKAARGWASDVAIAGKNFDFDWQGIATNQSDANGNTVGWGVNNCGGSTLAFMDPNPGGISNGWRITMCPQHNWSDGPNNPSVGQWDIQGIATHELGHALGLGHTSSPCSGICSGQATMCAFACGNGFTQRDITTDDANGLQAIYGATPANKPKITSLGGSFQVGQTLVITGQNFAPTVNVKFTAETTQNTGSIPGVVFNVPSSGGGTQVSVTIPAAAKKGNVFVWQPAQGLLSNGFPMDVGAAPPAPPVITGISPPQTDAFTPGTITVSGSGFTGVTQVVSGGASPGFTIVNDNTITYGAPAPTSLGAVDVTVTNPFGTSNPGSFTYVETSPPELFAPGLAITGQPLGWSFGGSPNDQWFLFWTVDPTTFQYNGFDILIDLTLAGLGALDAVGVGSAQQTVPPGLSGLILYSQVLTFDGVAEILATNITQTTVFF